MRKITLNNAASLRGSLQADAAIYISRDCFANARNDKKTEQGNVFFYILIAVALFAALSYAVSRNNTGSTNIFDEEQAKIAAQEIIEYGNTVSNAVQKLRLRGCRIVADDIQDSHIDISTMGLNFGNNENKTIDGMPIHAEVDFTGAPPDGSCSVFDVNGGNINAFTHINPNPVTPVGNVFKSGHGSIAARNYLGIGEDGIRDLAWHISDINHEACIKINEFLGVTNPSGQPPTESSTLILGDEAPEIAGKTAFCYYRDVNPKRHFFHQVLIAF